jgi:uncharacterized protein YmfQ (DUF2313 family)
MPEPLRRSGDAYGEAFAALLPSGIAWPRDPDTVLMMLARALAEEWARVDGRGADLLGREADPRATIELLGEWEAAFGLPDPCVAEPLTIEDRQGALYGRMTTLGGQSRAFFIQLAADLGYEVSIREYSPFMCGVSRVGNTGRRWEIGPPEIRFYWTVRISGARVRWFRAGSGRVGVDPFVTIGKATDLTCRLERLRPAHTEVLFDYSEAGSSLDRSLASNAMLQLPGWI